MTTPLVSGAAARGVTSLQPALVPSDSQRRAIEAVAEPVLVLAGPGSGKTFCLIERIRFLVEQLGVAPERVCAFTFTNKAADEIGARLARTLGDRAAHVKTGTIHAFCVELLREFGAAVGLETGFGIADEDYCLTVLRRIEGPRRWHRQKLTRFSAHRFSDERLGHDDVRLFARYEEFLARRRRLDFDSLVIHAAALLASPEVAPQLRARWDTVLIDEFQDLNRIQYRLVHELAREHRHIFAVGDHEQSIYSWAGADPSVIKSFLNDFGIRTVVHLRENRRCPRDLFVLARRLVSINPTLFDDYVPAAANRDSPFPVQALCFRNDERELAWLIDELRRDRAEYAVAWGDIAFLYRKHGIGEAIEAAFLSAGIPCKLVQGRAFAEDPVISYLLAALRVIADPRDDVHRDRFFATVLPRRIFDDARTRAEASGHSMRRQFNWMAVQLPRAHEDGRQIRRALTEWRNLEAIGRRHSTLGSLVQELLSKRVGTFSSILEEVHDDLSDPADLPPVVALEARLRTAREGGLEISLPPLGGLEIPLKGMLQAAGFGRIHIGSPAPPSAVAIGADDLPGIGLALGLFKALQLLESRGFISAFRDFTAIDLETTDNDAAGAEIVEIAAVRVRDGQVVDQFGSLVRPKRPISPRAAAVHGIRDADVATAPPFEDLWPKFRTFCGEDVVVAHNGYDFDFRVLQRMLKAQGKPFDLCTYDTLPLARDLVTTSCSLSELARTFDVPTGRSHRALDDARALASIFLALERARLVRARTTSLVGVLGHLGVALALSGDEPGPHAAEIELFRRITRPFSLGAYSGSLEYYESEAAGNESVSTVDQVIELLGGAALMTKIRCERTADDRYPEVMTRLRRILARLPDGPLASQLPLFLERAVLSRWDGYEPDRGRVSLLTLHSTKGLEFSRVYIVGAEDAELPGGSPMSGPQPLEIEEARRLLYVGMTRARDRLVLTRALVRGGRPTGGHRFLDEMGLAVEWPDGRSDPSADPLEALGDPPA